MTRAAIYTRVSSEEQADEGLSLVVQEQRGRAVALERGADIVEVYQDDGWSGTRFDRPALQRMLADLADLDMVIVWRLDRLSRSVRDWAEMMEMLSDHKVGLVSVTEAFDASNAYGRAMMGMLAVWAQLFVEMLRENVSAALHQRAESGRHHGRQPLGYRYDDGELVLVPEEAAVVRQVFDRYLGGDSLIDLAHAGYREKWPSGGGRWSAQKARRILLNPVYAGLIQFSGELYQGAHKPIISMADWRRAQERLAARTQRRGHGPKSLIRLYRCGICGARMVAQRKSRTSHHVRYVCAARPAHVPEERHQPCAISGLTADAVVRAWARHILSGPLQAAIKQAAAEIMGTASSAIERIDRDVQLIEDRLRYYHTAGADGTLPLDMVREMTAPLVRRREALQAERANYTGTVPELPSWVQDIAGEGIDYLFRHTDCDQQTEMLSQVFEMVEVHPDWQLVIKHTAPLPPKHVQVPRYAMHGDGLETNVARALGLLRE
ncbi:MAG: recombinase family protein [Armatimonadota bacterium]